MQHIVRVSFFLLVCLSLKVHASGFNPELFDEKHAAIEVKTKSFRLVLRGELELSLRDIEGKGGPGFDSVTDTQTIGTRSPTFRMDGAWFAPRFVFQNGLKIDSAFFFDNNTAFADRIAIKYSNTRRSFYVEAGLTDSLAATSRPTERFPLIATSSWRFPETHVAIKQRWNISAIDITLAASIGITRPLGFTPLSDAPAQASTLRVLSYGRSRSYSGNSPEIGASMRIQKLHFSSDIFGFAGRLANEAGLDELRNSLSLFDSQTNDRPRDHIWGGGRMTWDGPLVYWRAETILAKDSTLKRWGGYVDIGLRFDQKRFNHHFKSNLFLVRLETYRILNAEQGSMPLRNPSLAGANTWDFNAVTFAHSSLFQDGHIRLRAEYTFFQETNGIATLGIPNTPFKNNEFLLQGEFLY